MSCVCVTAALPLTDVAEAGLLRANRTVWSAAQDPNQGTVLFSGLLDAWFAVGGTACVPVLLALLTLALALIVFVAVVLWCCGAACLCVYLCHC